MMKERQRRLLGVIVEHQGLTAPELMARFDVSRRTLYYDIEQINELLGDCGSIQNMAKRFVFQGSIDGVRKLMQQETGNPSDNERRRRYVLRRILREQPETVDQMAEVLDISRNTVVQTIDEIRQSLHEQGLELAYNRRYCVVGDELTVRGLFVELLSETGGTLHEIGTDVLEFNKRHQLELTDFSLSYLHQLLCFVRLRIAGGNTLASYAFTPEVAAFSYYQSVSELLPAGAAVSEQGYITAFVATLPSLHDQVDSSLVDSYVTHLAEEFERQAAVPLRSREDFLRNIRRHIQAAYYRIKFRFPVYTPIIEEIRSRNAHLYKIVKGIIQGDSAYPEFANMRDEEIYFITAYFGAYLSSGIPKRVLIVCPSGLMISKSLELQLCRFIPGIRIVGSTSISALTDYDGEYDYIVSTIPLVGHDPVLVVNPLLTRPDLHMLMEKLVDLRLAPQLPDIERIMEIIGENCIVQNSERLYNQLLKELLSIGSD